MKSKDLEHRAMHQTVNEGIKILNDENTSINKFGKLLDEAWRIKKSFSNKISNPYIDNLYEIALNNGAIGGKLLGADSGGFILLFVNPRKQKKILEIFKNLVHVPFSFENSGSSTVLYQPNGL